MKSLKRLAAALALTLALGISALAGIIQSPPCSPPEPGIIQSPPCAEGQGAPDPAMPGQIGIPPASVAADASAFAINLLESLLPLF